MGSGVDRLPRLPSRRWSRSTAAPGTIIACERLLSSQGVAADRLRGVSNLDLLPVASMVDRAPPGYSNRVRTPIAGVDLETLDADVKAAGGWIERRPVPDRASVGRGRRVRNAQQSQVAAWYVIPDSALS